MLDIPTATDAATELIATELIELVELDSVPKDWEFDAPQNESKTDEMIKLKGNIVKTLRKKNKVVLSIMIGDSADISIEGNVITFSVASESDLDFIRLNIAILKEAADELLSGDYNIKLERLAASGEDELKKIVDLFSPSAVIIKNN